VDNFYAVRHWIMLYSSAHYPLSYSRYHSPPVWVEFYIDKLWLNKIFVFICLATCDAVSCSVSPPAQKYCHAYSWYPHKYREVEHFSLSAELYFISGHFSIHLIFSWELVSSWWWFWGFRSSGMRRCVLWWMIPNILKAPWSFEMSWITDPMTQLHIPEELNPKFVRYA
jgi:hypothetical protein